MCIRDRNGEGQIIGEIKEGKVKLYAKKVLEEIAILAHNNGEPGILFIDSINRANPTPQLGCIETTNPCGEQPLLPYEACNLGAINLGKFVKDSKIDYSGLKKIVNSAVRFLDNVVDMSKFPLKEIEETVKKNRKIGLGVMGFADMLSELGVGYDSEEGRKIGEEVMEFISKSSKECSVELAKERGVFPAFEGSIHDTGKLEDRVRNAAITTIAPTGTTGIIADASYGIEPYFAISYTHQDADGHKRRFVAKTLELSLIHI